jgi:predicted transcriptional regulator
MIEFIDFALLVNAKTFISLEKIADKFKNYTLEGIRKRLNKLCKQGLMEMMVLNHKTYYRATKKGYEAAMEFYKVQEMDVFINFFKKTKEQETKTSP